jgi:uncharacterized protein YjiS (DUF1127 family)
MARRLTATDPTLIYLAQAQSVPQASVIAVRLAVLFARWAERRRTRAALTQLTLFQLQDVGLTPTQARREALKPFWMT